MDKRETAVASPLGKTVGPGRSVKWADWVHVTNFGSRWLDSGFERPYSCSQRISPSVIVLTRGNLEGFLCQLLRLSKQYILDI